jgi:hypothetical protein
MDLTVWFSEFAVCLFAWWFLMKELQAFSLWIQARVTWNQDFRLDFLKSFGINFLHTENRFHGRQIQNSKLPTRLRFLWIGLRSMIFGFAFLFVFVSWGVSWGLIPVSTICIFGLIAFVISQWWKPLRRFAFFSLSLGIFSVGFEGLLQASSQLANSLQEHSWIFYLSENFLLGALLGIFIGAALRLTLRLSGVSWWVGANLLLAGVLSLGAAWGFILGDFFIGLLEDLYLFRDRDFRLRSLIGIGTGLVFLLLTTPFEISVMNWMNGGYSVQLRLLQLAVMSFVFLLIESAVALAFFHFYFLRQSEGRAT